MYIDKVFCVGYEDRLIDFPMTPTHSISTLRMRESDALSGD